MPTHGTPPNSRSADCHSNRLPSHHPAQDQRLHSTGYRRDLCRLVVFEGRARRCHARGCRNVWPCVRKYRDRHRLGRLDRPVPDGERRGGQDHARVRSGARRKECLAVAAFQRLRALGPGLFRYRLLSSRPPGPGDAHPYGEKLLALPDVDLRRGGGDPQHGFRPRPAP